MKEYIPLIVAFFGAGVGAFFAVLKSKSEKLWSERYDALKSVCEAANIIVHDYEALHMEDMSVSVMSENEKQQLSEDFIESRKKLRGAMASIKLLFSEKQAKEIEKSYVAMNGAITKALNTHPSEYRADNFWDVAAKAKELLDVAAKLARKKIL